MNEAKFHKCSFMTESELKNVTREHINEYVTLPRHNSIWLLHHLPRGRYSLPHGNGSMGGHEDHDPLPGLRLSFAIVIEMEVLTETPLCDPLEYKAGSALAPTFLFRARVLKHEPSALARRGLGVVNDRRHRIGDNVRY
ncbi:hypothetical protein EVAR_61265_1 [Eumeta japonica]|uniref:Uncharacterized protein n=1 Tax=Eumeta variegata TaxID=151549 RepID=A0A4C2A3G4_EUMVA|nr:hypothetical protein EVAR_61265_1 [Eumeta japonica]